MNTLTGSDIYIADELFATLDPTTRKVTLPSKKEFFITDTVGFINKLPHQLVDSFKATLEEVREADILLMVVDIAQEKVHEQKKAVEVVLEELDIHDKPVILVLNKIDLLGSTHLIEKIKKEYPDCVSISARHGDGIVEMLKLIESNIIYYEGITELLIPNKDSELISSVYKNSKVMHMRNDGAKTRIKVKFTAAVPDVLKKYIMHGR